MTKGGVRVTGREGGRAERKGKREKNGRGRREDGMRENGGRR